MPDLDPSLLPLRDALLAELEERIASLARPVSVQPDEACALFGFARSTFNRWLADPLEGLEDLPEPVVWRPNGPGGKVLVHVERMQAWLDARSGRRRKLSG